MSNNSEKKLLYCLKVPVKQVERVKQELLKKKIFIKDVQLIKELDFIFLPIEYSPDVQFEWHVEQRFFTQLQRFTDYQSSLQEKLPPDLHKFIPTSFDRLGDVILLKLDPELSDWKSIIGSELLKQFTVKSVFNKLGDVETEFRTIPWECIAGPDNPVTIHRMHGLRFRVDITKVYFNARLSNEYYRIASLCQDEETIIDMFAGIGPFALLCASLKSVTVYALDINPSAIELLHQNISLNKRHLHGTIYPSCGDSKQLIQSLPQATKIIMNLPGLAIDFLLEAAGHLAEGGTIFLHQFIHLSKEEKKNDLVEPAKLIHAKLSQINAKTEKSYSYVISGNKLRDVSPSKTHVVWDIVKKSL